MNNSEFESGVYGIDLKTMLSVTLPRSIGDTSTRVADVSHELLPKPSINLVRTVDFMLGHAQLHSGPLPCRKNVTILYSRESEMSLK